MKEKAMTRLVFLLFFLFGSALFGLGCYWAGLGRQSQSWDQVSGFLLVTKEAHSRIKGRSATGASVAYTYEYKGQKFNGSRLSFAGNGSDQLQEIQHLTGTGEVLVWVDPDKPGCSVLVPGIQRGAVVLMSLGGIWVGFMVFMFWSMIRRKGW